MCSLKPPLCGNGIFFLKYVVPVIMPVTVTETEAQCNTCWKTDHKINPRKSKGQTSDWPPNMCILTSQYQRKTSEAVTSNHSGQTGPLSENYFMNETFEILFREHQTFL